MTTVLEQWGLAPVMTYTPKNLPDAKDLWSIESKELIGIEIEVENQNTRRPSNTVWGVTEDGSLRNGGIEFISKPIPACHAPGALKHLFEVDLDGGKCFSPRTSTHVHLNVQDLTNEQVIDLVMIYSLFEKSLYRFVGKGRWKNIYCTPITETEFLRGLGENGVRTPWEKYTGLNLLPMREKGTVEFRHMHGTPDAKKLCVWIDLITHLKEYVKKNSTANIRRTIINFNGGQVNELAQQVFGPLAEYLNISDPAEVVTRVPLVKFLMIKSATLNRTHLKQIDPKAKFFTIK